MKEQNTIKRMQAALERVTGLTVALAENGRLKEDLGLDSLSLVALVVELEEEFNILFDEGDLNPDQLLRAGDLAALLEKYL